MLVSDAVAAVLADFGADTVFGVVGSGNFHVTNALIARGARFVAARHECGAASMADGWARLSGRPGILSVHQGPGLTNAVTGITEAAKSRTPLVVLAADVAASAIRSNFRIDVAALAEAIGAVPARLHSPEFAVDDTVRAYRTAVAERRTVVLALPLDVQAGECPVPPVDLLDTVRAGLGGTRGLTGAARDEARGPGRRAQLIREAAADDAATRLADAIREAKRPVFIAGRGARNARARTQLEQLGDDCGALLATSAAAKGLFRGSPWDLDVSGGFASPLAAELIRGADLLVGWGCSLNMWTMRHGSLVSPGTVVAQVDDEPGGLGGHRPINLGVLGDVADVAGDVHAAWGDEAAAGYRSDEIRKRIENEVRWRDVPFTDESDGRRIDPRTLTIALDDLLPAERIVAVDSGNFMGYPSMYLSVPDADGFCFTQAYQSIGLGLGSAIGSAIARPDRLVVAALGDGGALMGVSELETVVRLGLPMVVVVYDDEAYGAEVHHFGPDGFPLETVRFPPVNIAKIAKGFGFSAIKVRQLSDLANVREWLDGPRDEPLLIDAKVTSERGSWWLEEAFRGH
ncbi:MAG TPA: thiamine pyrophosphate-binding protein [Streptosporangiaceae bacterium]|jgi:thiamine pyrophosphate-dependent acetolactate synthase large subunit-like protein|nr:thiamine pyrophosphate-binding protein [Streptosporangiaceae bacterium]